MPLTSEGIIYRDSLTYTQPDLYMTFYENGVSAETGTLPTVVSKEVARFPVATVTQNFSSASKTNTIGITTTVDATLLGVTQVEYATIGILRDDSGVPVLSPELNGTFTSTTTINLGANYLLEGHTVVYNNTATTVTAAGNTITVADAIFPASGAGIIYFANGVLLALRDVGTSVITTNSEEIQYILRTKTAGQ